MIIEKEVRFKTIKFDYMCDNCNESNYKRKAGAGAGLLAGDYYVYVCNTCDKVEKLKARYPQYQAVEIED